MVHNLYRSLLFIKTNYKVKNVFERFSDTEAREEKINWNFKFCLTFDMLIEIRSESMQIGFN